MCVSLRSLDQAPNGWTKTTSWLRHRGFWLRKIPFGVVDICEISGLNCFFCSHFQILRPRHTPLNLLPLPPLPKTFSLLPLHLCMDGHFHRMSLLSTMQACQKRSYSVLSNMGLLATTLPPVPTWFDAPSLHPNQVLMFLLQFDNKFLMYINDWSPWRQIFKFSTIKLIVMQETETYINVSKTTTNSTNTFTTPRSMGHHGLFEARRTHPLLLGLIQDGHRKSSWLKVIWSWDKSMSMILVDSHSLFSSLLSQLFHLLSRLESCILLSQLIFACIHNISKKVSTHELS